MSKHQSVLMAMDHYRWGQNNHWKSNSPGGFAYLHRLDAKSSSWIWKISCLWNLLSNVAKTADGTTSERKPPRLSRHCHSCFICWNSWNNPFPCWLLCTFSASLSLIWHLCTTKNLQIPLMIGLVDHITTLPCVKLPIMSNGAPLPMLKVE